jgi:lipocalin
MKRKRRSLNDIDADFSTEDDMIILAKDKCEQLYETATMRAYKGIARMMDRLS